MHQLIDAEQIEPIIGGDVFTRRSAKDNDDAKPSKKTKDRVLVGAGYKFIHEGRKSKKPLLLAKGALIN